jgi:hypothetical protein
MSLIPNHFLTLQKCVFRLIPCITRNLLTLSSKHTQGYPFALFRPSPKPSSLPLLPLFARLRLPTPRTFGTSAPLRYLRPSLRFPLNFGLLAPSREGSTFLFLAARPIFFPLTTLSCPEQQRRAHVFHAISRAFILFRTLSSLSKRYLPSFQADPHSCSKTPRVGGVMSHSLLIQLSTSDGFLPAARRQPVSSLPHYLLTSLLQISIQLHSFVYGTRLIRYPDFTPVTT